MTATAATQITEKFRKDVEKVSQDKVRGEIVKRLRTLFAHAPAIRAKRAVQPGPVSAAPASSPVGAVGTRKRRK